MYTPPSGEYQVAYRNTPTPPSIALNERACVVQ
jgi:hypothetical protein